MNSSQSEEINLEGIKSSIGKNHAGVPWVTIELPEAVLESLPELKCFLCHQADGEIVKVTEEIPLMSLGIIIRFLDLPTYFCYHDSCTMRARSRQVDWYMEEILERIAKQLEKDIPPRPKWSPDISQASIDKALNS